MIRNITNNIVIIIALMNNPITFMQICHIQILPEIIHQIKEYYTALLACKIGIPYIKCICGYNLQIEKLRDNIRGITGNNKNLIEYVQTKKFVMIEKYDKYNNCLEQCGRCKAKLLILKGSSLLSITSQCLCICGRVTNIYPCGSCLAQKCQITECNKISFNSLLSNYCKDHTICKTCNVVYEYYYINSALSLTYRKLLISYCKCHQLTYFKN